MGKTVEDSLRRAMEALGHAIETVIGKASRARVQVGTRGGMQPVLSLEGQLGQARIRDIIEASTQRVMAKTIPDLKAKAALEVGEGPVLWGAKMLARQANVVVGVEIGGGSLGRQGDISRGFVIRAHSTKFPFPDGRFAYFLARMATTLQGDMVRALRELGRVLSPGGQGVVVDYHPFGLYGRRGGGRLKHSDPDVRRVEDYYRLCRQAGLRVVDVREAFVDEGIRQLFKEEEIAAYRKLKGTPLLIFLFVYKPKGS